MNKKLVDFVAKEALRSFSLNIRDPQDERMQKIYREMLVKCCEAKEQLSIFSEVKLKSLLNSKNSLLYKFNFSTFRLIFIIQILE